MTNEHLSTYAADLISQLSGIEDTKNKISYYIPDIYYKIRGELNNLMTLYHYRPNLLAFSSFEKSFKISAATFETGVIVCNCNISITQGVLLIEIRTIESGNTSKQYCIRQMLHFETLACTDSKEGFDAIKVTIYRMLELLMESIKNHKN